MNSKRTSKRLGERDKRLAAPKKMLDSEIDFSDIPEMDEAFWANAKLVKHPKKIAISIRLDEDVLQWFRENTDPYQREINRVLRTYVEHQRHTAA